MAELRPFKQGRHFAHLHYHQFNILLWVIALLAALIFDVIYKRQRLVGSAIHGKRTVDAGVGDAAGTE